MSCNLAARSIPDTGPLQAVVCQGVSPLERQWTVRQEAGEQSMVAQRFKVEGVDLIGQLHD